MTLLADPRLADCRRVFLSALSLEVSIGFYPIELAHRQRVLIDLDLFVPLAASTPRHDDIGELAVDYHAVRKRVSEFATSRHFNLQETLLDGIVALCLQQPGVRAVRASTCKPDIYADCAGAGVELLRFSEARG